MPELDPIKMSPCEADQLDNTGGAAGKTMIRKYVAAHPWKLGSSYPGKGIVTATGNVITWETSDGYSDADRFPYHGPVVSALGYTGGEYGADMRWMLRMDPDGTIQAYGNGADTGLATHKDITTDPYFEPIMKRLGLPTEPSEVRVSAERDY